MLVARRGARGVLAARQLCRVVAADAPDALVLNDATDNWVYNLTSLNANDTKCRMTWKPASPWHPTRWLSKSAAGGGVAAVPCTTPTSTTETKKLDSFEEETEWHEADTKQYAIVLPRIHPTHRAHTTHRAMRKAIDHLTHEFANLRTGRATTGPL